MTIIVQATAAQDLLAIVPELIGSTPESCLVVVLFAGSRSRGALRVGLPAGTDVDSRVGRAVAERALGFACRAPGVDAIVPVVYSDDAFGTGSEPPGRVIADAVLRLAREQGFVVKDALGVASDGWGSYLDHATPSGGRPLALIAAARVPAVDPLPSELMTTELPEVDDDTRAAIEQEYRAVSARLDALLAAAVESFEAGSSVGVGGVVERLDGLPERFEDAIARGVDDLEVQEVAFLLLALSRPWASDLALVHWAFGRALGEELDEAERVHGSEPLGAEDAEVFHRVALLLVGEGPRPDVERIRAALALVLGLAARAPGDASAAPLTMLAWLSWALGQSTRALAFLALLDPSDRDHGLAPTIEAMTEQGHLPSWVFAAEPTADAPAVVADQPAA